MAKPKRHPQREEHARQLLKLLRSLGADYDHPVTALALARMMGLPVNRQGEFHVRQAARLLNFQGVPVVSDGRGFWLATTVHEVMVYKRREIGGRRIALELREGALDRIADNMRDGGWDFR